jgi:hypothetical protein
VILTGNIKKYSSEYFVKPVHLITSSLRIISEVLQSKLDIQEESKMATRGRKQTM